MEVFHGPHDLITSTELVRALITPVSFIMVNLHKL